MISRRMRAESLQPRPEVVTPIWRGPSVWVLRRVKVQRPGASATLTGIRSLRQRFEMCVPIFQLVFGSIVMSFQVYSYFSHRPSQV